MLPPWHDELRLFVHPARIVLVHTRHGWRGANATSRTIALGPPSVVPAAYEALEASLSEVLGESAWRARRVRVTLSNHFVRYALLKMDGMLSNERQRTAYARHALKDMYGERAVSWILRMSSCGPDSPMLISGIAPELVQGLRRIITSAGMQLQTLQPLLMAVYNARRGLLTAPDAWFVIAERDHCVTLLLRQGRWVSVGCHGVGEGDLGDVLAREHISAALGTLRLPIYLFQDGSHVQDGMSRQMPITSLLPDSRRGLSSTDRSQCACALW